MKFLIIISLAALAVASPLDDKSQSAPKAGTTSAPLANPVPLNKAPLSPSPVDLHPLNKRDAPKSQPTAAPVLQKAQPAVDSSVKATDVNRKTRDTAQQPTAAPVNTQQQKQKSPASQPASTAPKKTRQAPKPADAKLTPTNPQATPTAANPQVARVPVTSTNSRSRRDAPKVVDQSKPVSSPAVAAKTDNTPQTVQSQGGNGQGLRRPAPVDQILRQKPVAATEAPKVNAQKN